MEANKQLALDEIRNNLKDIQYYFSMQNLFIGADKFVGKNCIVDRIDRYNDVMRHAPIRLHAAYISLYISDLNSKLTKNA